MNRLFFSLLVMVASVLIFSSCEQKSPSGEKLLSTKVVTSPEEDPATANPPIIEFEKEVHNFGRIVSGEKVSYSFKFKNTGKSALVISDVKSGCGCTVGSFPREPIAPGEGGKIEVVFDSSNRRGAQSQNVRVLSNTQPNVHVVRILSEVIAP